MVSEKESDSCRGERRTDGDTPTIAPDIENDTETNAKRELDVQMVDETTRHTEYDHVQESAAM